MSQQFKRRHSRWYECLLFSGVFQFFFGVLWVVVLPAWIRWQEDFLVWPLRADSVLNTLLVNLLCFVVTFVLVRRIQRFPGAQSLAYLLPTPLVIWSGAIALILFLREPYARQVLLSSFALCMIWVVFGYFVGRRYRMPKLAVVPFGQALQLADYPGADITILDHPNLDGRRYDAVVADLRAQDLSATWEKFLAQCTLARMPVFHSKQLVESLSGRVQIEHLSENEFGTLLPSSFYLTVKRFMDVLAAILLLPLLLPVMFITAVFVQLDSSGGSFFVQQRMGHRGIPFNVYKFRSMCVQTKGKGFTEGKNDPRITRVGHIIRKYRIDELPQIFNVLKGDMSFIGPRPESMSLAEWYEKDVPFFSYRHVVRPGISGWAQVNQGYAAEVDGMKEKLQYDFYYIKNFSFWLDLLIVFKTIKTILTGFGAR